MRHPFRPGLTACALLALAGCAAPGGTSAPATVEAGQASIDQRWVDTVVAADKAGTEFPGYLTARPGASLAQAYAAQARLVATEYGTGKAIGGFKGGFASPEALARFGITKPAIGVLPARGRVMAPYRLRLDDFRKLVIECEIGFELAREVASPIADVAAMKRLVAHLGPAIELPDVALASGVDHPLADMVAANISAARYIFVPSHTVATGGDINAIRAELARDGAAIAADSARKAYGDQWEALRSALNTAIEVGYRPKAGDVVLTGSIVQVVAERGHYTARYGSLGQVEFGIE